MKPLISREERGQFLSLLLDLRLNAGLKQGELAKILGCGQSIVSKFESGERRLDVLELRHVCHAVGISLVDFAEMLEQRLKKTLP